MKYFFSVILILFFFNISNSYAGNGHFKPIKIGEKAEMNGIIIDISAASHIISTLKNNDYFNKKSIELSNELCEEKLKLVDSIKESKMNVLTDVLKSENQALSSNNKQLTVNNKKLESKNKIKNYIIIILLSSVATYKIVN
jgi:hypothetical protein